MKKKLRMVIGFVLVMFIIIMIILIFINKDTIFRQDVTITYSDKCVERWTNGVLVTPICEKGRALINKTMSYEEYYKESLKDLEWGLENTLEI